MSKKSTSHGKKSPATTTPPPSHCHIVGIGASAGGLNAFRELFENLPADTGLAFLLLQHQSPDRPSLLPELLRNMTAMPVQEAAPNMAIEANNVYVLPARQPVQVLAGHFQPLDPQPGEKPYLPIDKFFKHLADTEGNRTIGVILSGSASDGALGLKAIKAAGGITFAQDLGSSEHPGMPQAAAATGSVDFVRSPADIAREIHRIVQHPLVQAGDPLTDTISPPETSSLDGIFLLLRRHTGNDFALYKPTTILRRIQRRMVMLHLSSLSDYRLYLQRHKQELDALFQDLLINVTQFFRDPDLYQALHDQILPSLLKQRSSDTPLRIWIPGCSSGEEVYSVAMSVVDCLGKLYTPHTVQIFGTDIDADAISQARRGLYTESQIQSIPDSYREQFFQSDAGAFRISKTIRDICVFSIQNLLRDPPFSRLDMICCRNLLIYLNQTAQRKLLRVFHYALRDAGRLVLGSSETVGSETELFSLENNHCKIYLKKTTSNSLAQDFSLHTTERPASPPTVNNRVSQDQELFRKADQALLQQYCPPGVLIDQHMEIIQFRGKTGPFLEPIPGTASLNLLKMVRQEFLVTLRTGVRRAIKEGLPARHPGLKFRHQDQEQQVDIQILPLPLDSTGQRYLLVLFETIASTDKPAPPRSSAPESAGETQQIRLLEQELAATREYMQSIIEDQEAGNEELQSANEEVQSTNEELQSINEELETAKEELQSTNEELATVNDELEQRNHDLGDANNDLVNLNNSVNLPMVMLDDKLNIRQFTPAARQLLKLIDGDMGRCIRDLRPNISYDQLDTLVPRVIDTMTPQFIEVEDLQGRCYTMQVRPYKTLDNRIEGVVIAFVDRDDSRARQHAEALLEAQRRLNAQPLRDDDRILLVDLDGQLQACNQTAARLHGTKPSAMPASFAKLLPEDQREATRQQLAQLAADGQPLTAQQTRLGADGQQFTVRSTLSLLLDPQARPSGFLILDRPLDDAAAVLEREVPHA